MKRLWVSGAALLALAVGGIGYWNFRENSAPLVSPTRGSVVEAVYGLGTVTPERTFRQTFGVSLPLLQSYVTEGQEVKQGSPLVKTENGISKAPFDGTVTSIPFKEGELIPPQTPVVTMISNSRPYIEVSLEQQAALRVRKDQRATLSFETLRGETFQGKVRTLFPKDGQFLVRIDIEKLPAGVMVGMTADTAIEVGRKQDALLVPLSAISAGKVVVLRDGTKRKVDVTVGIVDGEKAEITAGDLKPQDQIIVRQR